MSATLNRAMVKRAVVLFPRTAYLSDAAVRHARRQWLRSVSTLRTGRGWVVDGAVGWQVANGRREAA